MDDLRKLTEELLDDPQVADKLALADKFMTQLVEFGDQFVLPTPYKYLVPILERYTRNLDEFVAYVKALRDSFSRTSLQYQELQVLFRRLEVRRVQILRRGRLDAAVEAALRAGVIKNDYDTKMRYSRRCTQVWKRRRDAMLDEVRGHTASGRVTVEEREGLLAEFWAGIDEEIKKGDLPKP